MKYKKRITAFIVATQIAFGATLGGMSSITASASAYWPSNVGLSGAGESAVVMDVNTGTVLYEQNGDVKHYPASITKILTALVALENTNLNDEVVFSSDAVYKNEGDSSHIARDLGEKMTMEECLYGMMLESANECAYAIAEFTAAKNGGGEYQDFIKMMNDKAKELGCKNTHFNNANGLPDEEHYTTAYDMALISSAAYRNDTFAKITGTKSYKIPPTNKHSESTLLNNHHAMLNYYQTSKHLYDYCVGGKTGYTTVANSTLVTYAKKDDMTLVCVIMNANSPDHYLDTRSLMDYCFDNFTVYNVSEYANIFSEQAKSNAGIFGENIDLIKVDEEGQVILPKTVDFSEAEATIVPDEDENDESVGRIEYTYGGKYVGGADLLYTESSVAASYPFHNIDAEDGGSKVDYIRIDFTLFLWIALIVGAIAGVAAFIHAKSGKILLYKSRKIDSKRRKKTKYKQIRRKRARRLSKKRR